MTKSLAKAEKLITTKELANVLNVDVRTVQMTAKRILDLTKVLSQSTNGRPTQVFTEEQATAIKQEIAKHHNLASRQIDNAATDLEMYQNVQKCMEWLSMKNLELQQKAEALQIELDQSKEWASVKRMQALNDCAFDWRALRDYSKKHHYEIKKVFDQNYGEVNAYHKDVWEAVYGEQIEVWED